MERSVLPATDDNNGLTRHSTKMAQNGSRVIGKDSEVPSMPTAKERENMAATFLLTATHLHIMPLIHLLNESSTYLEKGSDLPTGKPLPCVFVSTFP